jgi:hypothetical protein
VRAAFTPSRDPEQHGGTLSTVSLLDTGKTFGTNNREQKRPNPNSACSDGIDAAP